MSLEENYNLEAIRNEAAERVYERVERLLAERPEICRCETCVLDLVAYVLNRVTPRYSTSLLGNLHLDAPRERKFEVELDLALQAGLKRLKDHPHHD